MDPQRLQKLMRARRTLLSLGAVMQIIFIAAITCSIVYQNVRDIIQSIGILVLQLILVFVLVDMNNGLYDNTFPNVYPEKTKVQTVQSNNF
jgi:hypothetical protein